MLYCRMFVEWFSQKMVGPFFISSFGSSTAERKGRHRYQGRIPNRPWLHDSLNARHKKQCPPQSRGFDSHPKHHKAVTTCQEERARPAANSKKTRPHSSHNARHSMQSAGCAACQSTTTQSRTPQMTHSISITCSRSASIPNSNSTQQASNPHTPAATGSEATKTHQHQSAH